MENHEAVPRSGVTEVMKSRGLAVCAGRQKGVPTPFAPQAEQLAGRRRLPYAPVMTLPRAPDRNIQPHVAFCRVLWLITMPLKYTVSYCPSRAQGITSAPGLS